MKMTHFILSLLVLTGAGSRVAAQSTDGNAPNLHSPGMTDTSRPGALPQAPRAGSPADPCGDRSTSRSLPTPDVSQPGESVGSASGLNTPNPLPDDPFSRSTPRTDAPLDSPSFDESRVGGGNTPGGGPLDGGPLSGGTLGAPPSESRPGVTPNETNRNAADSTQSVPPSTAPQPGAGSSPQRDTPREGRALPCPPVETPALPPNPIP